MRNKLLIGTLAASTFFTGAFPIAAMGATYHQRRAHHKTAKRVGVGAAGGAAVGALAGGGKGALIGGAAGAGAGALYDRHKKRHGQ